MINLILTILCSTTIALILKFNDTKQGNGLVLLLGNYLVASIIAGYFLSGNNNVEYELPLLVFGLLMGFMFVASFFLFTQAVKVAGVSLSTVSARISVTIPILFSVIFYNEIPNSLQIIGILFTLLTIGFFYISLKSKNKEKQQKGLYLFLFLLFAGIGLGDFGMKIFENNFSLDNKSFFLFLIFFSAFIYTFVAIRIKNIKIDKKTFILGMLLGIPNIFSSFFLIEALNKIEAIIVYPVANIGIIILTSIFAVIFFKEKLNKYEIIGIITGALSIGLMSIK